MPEIVVIPLAGIGTLAMTRMQFSAALAQGEALALRAPVAEPSPPPVEELVDAKALETRTGVPASWWMAQARQQRIPFLRIGRRVRFNAREVLADYAVRRQEHRSTE